MGNESVNYNKKDLPNFKTPVVAIVGGIVLLLFFILVLNYFNILSISKANPLLFGWLPKTNTAVSNPSSPVNNPDTSTRASQINYENGVPLPVRVDSPSIQWVKVSYGFKGTIVDMAPTANGLVVVTDINDVGVPGFLITDRTKVFIVENGKEKPVKSSDLAKGQKVLIDAFFAMRSKTWDTVNVFIIAPLKDE
jgi:hypothetical protein